MPLPAAPEARTAVPDDRVPVTLCVDAGTTLIKAVVFDETGHEIAVADVPTAVSSPAPGHSEQDMDEVWAATVEAIRSASGSAGRRIELIAVTAQGDGAWLVDADQRPVRPAILWNDARAGDVLADWTRRGVLAEAFEVNGSLSNLGLPNAILADLRDREPESLARTAAVLTCGSWLFLRLSGVAGLHPSDASAPWLDIRSRSASEALLELYGLGDQTRLLPTVLTPEQTVRPLRVEVADALGLTREIPVVLAPYDVVAMATGTGTAQPGQAYCVLGTTLCTGTVLERPDTSGEPAGLTLDIGLGTSYLRAFPTLAGTGVVDWAVSLLGLSGPAELAALATTVPPGADELSFWPYLSPAGERAPFLDTAASGVLAGLHFQHGRAHLARAVLEGLGRVIRDCLDATGVAATELRLCGGGAASDEWTQLLADLTGVATVRTTDTQVGAKGALVHALVSTGHRSDLDAAIRDLVVTRDRHEPDPSTRALYDRRHRAFLEDRQAFAQRWSTWRDASPGSTG